ncbi:hypothetical protein [Desulfovibrio inopinatus]|uniref:hypothetical protein n=1 Tax=Desulfovibrio inopinatus TaxID=102109 RepID=UPI00040C0167|nr:hypothetical protein [Desulfovibrio inopinatus]
MDIQFVVGGNLLPYQTQATDAEKVGQTAAIEKSAEGQSENGGTSYGGDQVSISEEGRQMSATVDRRTLEDDREQEKSEKEQRIQEIKDRIEEIQQEMSEIAKDETLTEKEKQTQTQALTQELLQLNNELGKLRSSSGQDGRGTRAEGMANSLT